MSTSGASCAIRLVRRCWRRGILPLPVRVGELLRRPTARSSRARSTSERRTWISYLTDDRRRRLATLESRSRCSSAATNSRTSSWSTCSRYSSWPPRWAPDPTAARTVSAVCLLLFSRRHRLPLLADVRAVVLCRLRGATRTRVTGRLPLRSKRRGGAAERARIRRHSRPAYPTVARPRCGGDEGRDHREVVREARAREVLLGCSCWLLECTQERNSSSSTPAGEDPHAHGHEVI
jgi:hypothetical protein